MVAHLTHSALEVVLCSIILLKVVMFMLSGNSLIGGVKLMLLMKTTGLHIHSAAAEGETEAALELMRHGADNAVVAGTFGTPLNQAACGGHPITLRALLDHGCSLDIVSTRGPGRTVLYSYFIMLLKVVMLMLSRNSLIEVVMLMLLMPMLRTKTTALHFTMLHLKVKQKQHWS
jgi:hypothetical protein